MGWGFGSEAGRLGRERQGIRVVTVEQESFISCPQLSIGGSFQYVMEAHRLGFWVMYRVPRRLPLHKLMERQARDETGREQSGSGIFHDRLANQKKEVADEIPRR